MNKVPGFPAPPAAVAVPPPITVGGLMRFAIDPVRPARFSHGHSWLPLILAVIAGILTGVPASAQKSIGRVYAGTLGDSIRIVMTINSGDSDRVSSYYYCNYARPITLNGKPGPDHRFTFEEEDGESGRTTGRMTGTIDPGWKTLSGEWTDGSGRKHLRLSAEHIADVISVDTSWRKGKTHAEFTAAYPRFLPGMKGYVGLNDSLQALIAGERKGLYDWFVDSSEGDTATTDADAVEFELGTSTFIEVGVIDRGYVTLCGNEEYDGGAHPSYSMPHYNYMIVDNHVVPVNPERAFRKGSGFRAKLGKMLYAELKRTEYPCMESLEQSMLEEDENAMSFAVAGRGLLFRLWPGPHACGSAEDIFIPYSKIKDLIDPSGPLGPLVGGDR